MKNPWSDMIPLLPLQEFMSLTYVRRKLRAFADVPSSMSTSFMQLGHFTMFHPSCSAPRFVLS
ncbi:hypothetical protein BHM03_00015867 [Ensete ventricosum]|uniref:Uncharacterized protein n=1 Tax=Ensete ventricosum TaxID=4639 RepID=A0A427B5X7_ENSVE|nr:hypothetical protein B296_00016142 [Ensete ventricosum]RZR88322.1 hypothetical protein BHM03_00015867 [Ensete ventricosum]